MPLECKFDKMECLQDSKNLECLGNIRGRGGMSPKEIYIFHVGLERFYKMSMFKKLMALGPLGMYSVSPANVQ